MTFRDTAPWFPALQVLDYGASESQARAIAARVVTAFGSDPDAWLELGGFEVKEEPVASHGLEGLCIPMNRDRFRFVVFTVGCPEPNRRAFLICHEVAHTFFYERHPARRPKRGMLSSDWEEAFCDAFAEAVIGESAVAVGLRKVAA